MRKTKPVIFALCIAAFIAHAAFSIHNRGIKSAWANVPPVPAGNTASMLALGDKELAYRMIGITLQNLGDSGGDVTPLKDYDYDRLGQWFYLEDKLDPHSNFVPLLAAYYYGSTQNPAQLDPVIDYLKMVGMRPEGQKWRWLAQAVYLARFRQHDFKKARGLADTLAASYRPGMPSWTLQMPAFIATDEGDKKAAYDIMISILKDSSDKLNPNEVNFMVWYICSQILDKTEASANPLCQKKK